MLEPLRPRPPRAPRRARRRPRPAKVDVIAPPAGAGLAAGRVTKTIPIVMVNVPIPSGIRLVASLARPAATSPGSAAAHTGDPRQAAPAPQRTLPRLARVAVLHSSSATVGLRQYETAGQALELRGPVRRGAKPRRSWSGLRGNGARQVDAVVVPGDTFLSTERQRVTELAREHRLPGIYSTREFTEAGGLMSYSARLTEQFRRAAVYVDKILRGAGPGTLPVESRRAVELVINLKTARAFGLTIPSSLLARADQVIE